MDLEVVKVAERDVQHRAVFRGVDVLASEHLVADGLDIRFTVEVEEGRQDGLGDQVLGEVQQERYRRVRIPG